ncbi:MAG TPA: DUF4173 domain-containing protein [Clostridia bacterium]|nr:DUF4173 domain-containing protein [Clostridia bacterium]
MEDIPVTKDINNDNSILKRENVYLLGCTLLLGLLFNILFYGKALGISYPIFVISFYAVLLWNSRKMLKPKFDIGWLLTIPILALSSTYFIFSNPVFMVLNFLGIPVLIIAQTTLITGNNEFKWHSIGFIADIFWSMFVRMFANIFKPFILAGKLIGRKKGFQKHTNVIRVVIGLSISIPLVLIVTLLLSSADQVFSSFIDQVTGVFINVHINIGEFIVRAGLVIIICIVSFSYLWGLINPKYPGFYNLQNNKTSSKGIWDPVVILTILISINMIYVLFTVIQFSYLFGSLGNSLPHKLTYAEYARKGFFELIVVTLINLGFLLVNINLTKKGGPVLSKALNILNSLLIACTAIMLFSAHFRMSMYEETYGYTYLRLLTHAFMAFIAVLLLIALFKLWYEKTPLVKAYIIAALLSYMVVNYINIDALIAQNNINRYHKTHKIDTSYLTSLSYDATPSLVKLVKDKNKNVSVVIQNHLFSQKENLSKKHSWQSFNISKYRAKSVLSKYKLKYEAENLRER